ncbi:MAG: hypothetical protein GPJ54_21575 [Candidatus Heimdallarchaeota archaeon]|nr:hypothetical protein [Candidatus Heimdallarchaeota archaeon]
MRKSTINLPSFILDLITNPFKFTEHHQPLSVQQMKDLSKYFVKQEQVKSNIVYLGKNYNDVLIVGDLHGDLKSAVTITKAFLEEKVESIVFLGDFVDRGNHSQIVLCYLMALSISWPKRIQLLKGNHEDLDLNRRYGFEKQLRVSYPKREEFQEVVESLDKIYNNLSLCAVTPQNSFCCHGGISAEIGDLEDFTLIPKPHSDLASIRDMDLQVKLIAIYRQINWNDPVEDQKANFDYSYRGLDIYTFNEKALQNFLIKTGCSRIIRAHESSRGGFQSIFHGKLLHIFSSQPYFGKIKEAYVIHETDKQKTFLRKINFNLSRELSSK